MDKGKKKILVITYYWPPSGGGGVQRWLKFTKYLPEFGWEPVVFTPENPEFDLKDDTLNKDVRPDLEVIRFPIWEPMSIYKKLFKKKGDVPKQGIVIEKSKMTFMEHFSVWVRANLFIPDPRRYWVKPSVEFLVPYIEQHEIDVVVTTGPPHSMHLIGMRLKKKCKIKWVADFRDPWSDWDILDKLGVKGIARAWHQRLEKQVLHKADHVITTSEGLMNAFQEKHHEAVITAITNGFDEDDYKRLETQNKPNKFRITHLGLLNELRNPVVLWNCLEELCEEDSKFQSDLEIVLAGMVSSSIIDRIESSDALKSTLNKLEYLSHEQVFEYYQASSLLLLLLNQTDEAQLIIPGKLFEYLMVQKPILAIGKKKSEVNEILVKTAAGEVLDFEDISEVKKNLLKAYEMYKNGIYFQSAIQTAQYSRKALTQELVNLLETKI